MSIALPASHKLLDAVVAVLAAGCAVIAFAAVVFVLNRGDMDVALMRLRQGAGRWAPRRSPASADPPEPTQPAAVHELVRRTEDGAVPYRSHAMATVAELGYPVTNSQSDTDYAVVEIKKGRRVAVVTKHHSRPLSFALITQVLASARLSGLPTLLVANQPVTLAAAELAADATGFETVHWTGECDNDELVRGLTSLGLARHRR